MPDYSDIWDIKPYKEDEFWFMKIDDAEDAVLVENIVQANELLPENCIVEVPSIVIVIETGLGYYTYPMLVLETKMNAHVRNWSSDISVESSLCLGMAYYNSTMAVWEPLIEPNEREKPNGLYEYGPWELNFSMKIEKNIDLNSTDESKFFVVVCVSIRQMIFFYRSLLQTNQRPKFPLLHRTFWK